MYPYPSASNATSNGRLDPLNILSRGPPLECLVNFLSFHSERLGAFGGDGLDVRHNRHFLNIVALFRIGEPRKLVSLGGSYIATSF